MKKNAIIDFHEQDPGLKILFPESDYFIYFKGFNRTAIYNNYKIIPTYHSETNNIFNIINDLVYDSIFVIFNTYSAIRKYNNIIKTNFVYEENIEFLDKLMFLVFKNNFKNIFIFDNYDYPYDPNIIMKSSLFYDNVIKTKNIIFFKRNFDKTIQYCPNVFPFPYIMFGKGCNINTVNFQKSHINKIIPGIFFSGTLFKHVDNEYGIIRNRQEIMEKIIKKVPINMYSNLPHDIFMNKLNHYKYSLDLLGVGDPNIRTFEILSSNSLRIAERSNFKWNFDDDFCEETYFYNENDLYNKLLKLENDVNLYNYCLQKQNFIVSKYMNFKTLRNYIEEKMK